MPSALIEVRRRYSEAEEAALIDALHGALVAAFRIPPEDKHIRLIAHTPHRFAAGPDLSHPDRYTLVSLDVFAGRSLRAKRALYAEIVTRFEEIGIPRDHVMIRLNEIALDNWGLRGGQAASDIDLGFEVNV